VARRKSSGIFLIAVRQADTIRCEPEDRDEDRGALRDGRGASAGDDRQGMVARGAGGVGGGDGAEVPERLDVLSYEVGLARLPAKLIALLELVLGVGISHGLSVFFAYFTQTKRNLCCFVFAFSDMHHITTQSHGLVAKFWANVCLDAFHLDVLLGDPPSLHRHPRVQIQRLRGPYVGSPPITLADAIRQGAGDGGDFAKNSHNDPELQQHFTFPTARSTTR
jgi:hypothetical protein